MVADTGKRARSPESAYNERRAQCEEATAAFRAMLGGTVSALRDVSEEDAMISVAPLDEPLRAGAM